MSSNGICSGTGKPIPACGPNFQSGYPAREERAENVRRMVAGMAAFLSMIRPVLGVMLVLLLQGCAGRPLPRYEKPLKRAGIMKVRTTAYTHTESDHTDYGRKNALGTTLKSGCVNSAAADWSRWPAGTLFRIAATGEIFEVDDLGWALSGTNTIDLYKPSRGLMNEWGVRRVTIEILEWGNMRESYRILKPRSKYRHIKRMVRQMEQREL